MSSVSQNPLNDEKFLTVLQKHLNAALLEAAEPVIQEALQTVEKRMREKLAERLIGLIHTNFSIQKYQEELHIVVHQAKDGRHG